MRLQHQHQAIMRPVPRDAPRLALGSVVRLATYAAHHVLHVNRLDHLVSSSDGPLYLKKTALHSRQAARSIGRCRMYGACTFGGAGVEMQLLGEHQRENAVTAIGAALALRRQGFLRLDVPSILAGLQAASLPARFQVMHVESAARSSEMRS